MAKFRNLIIAVLLLGLGSCSDSITSPMLYFSNASPAPINNIECNWAKKHVLKLPKLLPGDTRSTSFQIDGPSNFFGLVKIKWYTDAGELIEREFYFREKHLPEIANKEEYNYVQVYLDQHDMEILSSDAANLTGRTQRMDAVLAYYQKEYQKNHPDADISLIKVDPRKDNSLPAWINRGD